MLEALTDAPALQFALNRVIQVEKYHIPAQSLSQVLCIGSLYSAEFD